MREIENLWLINTGNSNMYWCYLLLCVTHVTLVTHLSSYMYLLTLLLLTYQAVNQTS